VLLAIWFFSLITYPLLLNVSIKNGNKDFLGFNFFFNGFSTQFPKIIFKTSTLCSAKILSQEDSKIANPILKGVKKSSFLHFKRYNLTIYVAKFLKTFSTHYFETRSYGLIQFFYSKVPIYAIYTRSGSFGVFCL
jgi:hypothetical protein